MCFEREMENGWLTEIPLSFCLRATSKRATKGHTEGQWQPKHSTYVLCVYQCQVESYSAWVKKNKIKHPHTPKIRKAQNDKFYFMQNSYVCDPLYNIKFCCKCCTFLSGFFFFSCRYIDFCIFRSHDVGCSMCVCVCVCGWSGKVSRRCCAHHTRLMNTDLWYESPNLAAARTTRTGNLG